MSRNIIDLAYVNTNNRDIFCNAISSLITAHCCYNNDINTNKVIIYEGYLDDIITNHLSSSLNTFNNIKYYDKLPVYFVSDIRSADLLSKNNHTYTNADARIEQAVKQDMELQKQWIEKINPDAALLKMR